MVLRQPSLIGLSLLMARLAPVRFSAHVAAGRQFPGHHNVVSGYICLDDETHSM
jgi:NAD/NADP transhydrogenase beta subunit